MARIYRDRTLLRLMVPIRTGSNVELCTFDVIPTHARHVRNDHNHADELEVTADWDDTGVDPRWIAGATCEYYLGSADEDNRWEPDENSIRFVGRMVKPSRIGKGDSLSVTMLFHDYTSHFLLAKPVETKAIPLYSDTLQEAWVRLCEHIPGVADLSDKIELRGLDAFPVIGSAVAERFRKKTSLHTKPGNDAWAIWQQCVGMMGLISFFELDTCIVTTASDLYTLADPPSIIWGRDLLDFTEERNNDRGQKGVGITSFNPITGRTLESLYNPLADNVKKLKPAAKVRRKPQTIDDSKEYDIFAYAGITDQTALDALARRVYEERSRQELEGTLTTAEMLLTTASGQEFDLLSLGSGDAIEVKFIDSDDAVFVKNLPGVFERVTYLVEERGYSEPVARIIAGNVDSLTTKSSLFHVKSVTTELEASADGGSFRVSIAYCNKIDPKGGTATS